MKTKSLTQVCAMPKVTQWMTGITDSTFLEKPGSNICYLSNSADSRGHENTGKGTRKADETRMSSEKEERRIEPDFEGGNTGNRTEWGGQCLEGKKQMEHAYGKRFPHLGRASIIGNKEKGAVKKERVNLQRPQSRDV